VISQRRETRLDITKIPKSAKQLARVVSWVGHPLVFVTVTVGIVVGSQLARRDALSVLLILFVAMILPTALLLFGGVRSGHWSDADISVRTERKRFYPVAIPLSAIGFFALWLLRAPDFILRGALVTVALFALAAITNLRIKLSLHALFAFFCSVILFRISPAFGGVAFALSLGVFWARLYLQRHDVVEMLSGTLLGLGGGIATAWWP
jgi:hypothetical protein